MRPIRFVTVLAFVVTEPLPAQQLDGAARARALNMLHDVHHDIERYYYDSTYRGIDLGAAFAHADSGIRQANSMAQALALIAQATLTLHDSHTLFMPPRLTAQSNYGWTARMIGDSCLVDSVVNGSDAERQGVTPGDAILAIDGQEPTRRSLLVLMYAFHWIRPQSVLHVNLPGRQLDLAAKTQQRLNLFDLSGLDNGRDIWALINDERDDPHRGGSYTEAGDALVWRMPTFMVTSDIIHGALDRAQKKSTFVLDLRGNGGGAVSTLLALAGELFDHDLTIATLRQRDGDKPMVVKSRGTGAFTGKLVVLIDSRSASASEILARTVQLQHRGTVIGDRSAGMVMRSRGHLHSQLAETLFQYGTTVTDADVIMSDGGRLEGAGVVPDVLVLPSSADLRAHRDPALARALGQ